LPGYRGRRGGPHHERGQQDRLWRLRMLTNHVAHHVQGQGTQTGKAASRVVGQATVCMRRRERPRSWVSHRQTVRCGSGRRTQGPDNPALCGACRGGDRGEPRAFHLSSGGLGVSSSWGERDSAVQDQRDTVSLLPRQGRLRPLAPWHARDLHRFV